MRILFLIRSLDTGGAERQLVVLARGLKERGHTVAVAVFYEGGAFTAELTNADIPILSVSKRGRGDVPGFFWRLLLTCLDFSPDIIHSYLDVSNVVASILRPFLKGTRIVWGIRASNMALGEYDWLSRLASYAQLLLHGIPDLVIANSESGRNYAAALGLERLVVIPNGIDTNRFRPDHHGRNALRAQWGILSENEILIGRVARVDPMKDHRNFLGAASRLADRRDIRFICVGGGPLKDRQELEEEAGRLGLANKLMWWPPQVEMTSVYNALDIVVSSSSFGEGFPNVVAEAMACGVPCVVTDVGDSRRIVGDAGIVVPPRDSERLAKGILEALSHRDALASRTRKRIVDHFSLPVLVETTEKALKRVLGAADENHTHH